MSRSFVLIALLCAFSACSAQVQTAGWRSDGDGRYLDANPPLHWAPDSNVAWKTPLPSWSNASPVLVNGGDRLFVCSEPDKIMAVNRADGAILWKDSVGKAVEVEAIKAHDANGYSSATPVTDGEHVFSVFGVGAVASHTVDGELLWARVVQQPQHGWGHSASPALGKGVLVVHIVDLFGLDPATGEEKWRVPAEVKWGSPVVADIGGTEVVITPAGDVFRAADGQTLAHAIGNMEFATPVVQDGVVYFIEKKSVAVKLPSALGDSLEVETLWQSRIKGSRHYASPVIHDGLIYAVSREEKFTVLEAASGAVVYEKDLELNGSGSNSAYPSVTLAGDKLFVSSESGVTLVLEPGRVYSEVARNQVEGFRSSPVFAGDRMYLRAFDHLYCFSEKN